MLKKITPGGMEGRPIHWKDAYRSHVQEVDLQHQYFLAEINKIEHVYADGYKNLPVEDILKEIMKYAKFHVKSEEGLMIEQNDPAYDLHKKEHEEPFNKLLCHLAEIKGTKENLKDLHTFLIEWFSGHMTKEDQEFGKFFNSLR